MPFYKSNLPGAKYHCRHNLSEAMKRQALHTRCPQCGHKSDLKHVLIEESRPMRICR